MTESQDESTKRTRIKFGSPLCLQCGYSLVGLEATGVCPECGNTFGDELTLLGFQNPRSGIKKFIVVTVALLLIGFVSWFLFGFYTCMSAPFIGMGVYMGWRTYRTHRAITTIGADLRWVIDSAGIRTVRYENTEIQLLPWSEIKDIWVKSTISFREKGWRALHTRRSLFSVDLARMRAQEIWFEDVSRKEMEELRSHLIKLKKSG